MTAQNEFWSLNLPLATAKLCGQCFPQQGCSSDPSRSSCNSHHSLYPPFLVSRCFLSIDLGSTWDTCLDGELRITPKSWPWKHTTRSCSQVVGKVQGMHLEQGVFLHSAQFLDCESSPVHWALISRVFLIFIQHLFNNMHNQSWKSILLKGKPAVSSQDTPWLSQKVIFCLTASSWPHKYCVSGQRLAIFKEVWELASALRANESLTDEHLPWSNENQLRPHHRETFSEPPFPSKVKRITHYNVTIFRS